MSSLRAVGSVLGGDSQCMTTAVAADSAGSALSCGDLAGTANSTLAVEESSSRASDAASSAATPVEATGPDSPAVPALEFRDLSFSYTGAPLIQGLSLVIPAGGVFGIVGPNGCGKSTLLKIADGLLAPASGEVLVEGNSVAELSAGERARRVALLPQVHRTPSMSVESLVMCGRYAHMGAFGRPSAEDRAIVADALRSVHLEHMAARSARALSGGERQRAFIAMALAQRARTLLLDEPTTYLDVRAAHDAMALVKSLAAERGLTVVMVLHDLDLALRTCDRMAVMSAGRIANVGTPTELLECGALERAFDIRIAPVQTPAGTAHAFW